MRNIHIYKGDLFYFTDSPLENKNAYSYIIDGALVVGNGKVIEAGAYHALKVKYPSAEETDYTGKLIMPGLIDAHVHYVQAEIIGMYGRQLLDWLNDYTFPAEAAFSSAEHAASVADIFLSELFRNGTTTCVAYSSVHPVSVDALFGAASRKNMRIIAGKTLMDRNVPEGLKDDAKQCEEVCRGLIERWHNRGRNSYAITPRFAIACTPRQLDMAARLHQAYPDTYIQTHLSENLNEISATLSLYPGHSDYLEVYERKGLLTSRTLLGHCIHLSDSEMKRIAGAGAVIAHCPTSNMFLGSGLFDMKRANDAGAHTVLATDVGAGTSFSMFKTMGESYKIMQMQGYPMPALETFYKSTLGTARALKLDKQIGSFGKDMEADFIVVDSRATEIQALRENYLERTGNRTIENILFGLQIMGDDRNIAATYLMGEQVY